jgi:hypothetical protein
VSIVSRLPILLGPALSRDVAQRMGLEPTVHNTSPARISASMDCGVRQEISYGFRH